MLIDICAFIGFCASLGLCIGAIIRWFIIKMDKRVNNDLLYLNRYISCLTDKDIKLVRTLVERLL